MLRPCFFLCPIAVSLLAPAVAAQPPGTPPAPSKPPPAASKPAAAAPGAEAAEPPASSTGEANDPEAAVRAEARAAYQEGEVAYAAGDWATAREKYARANELVPSVNAAYWVAVCLDRMARSFEAALAYDEVLRSPDVAKLGDQRIADVSARFEELKKVAVGELRLATTPVAKISVDGEPRGETPIQLLLAPGTHELLLEAEGFQTERVEVALPPGKVLDETLELKAVEAPPPPPVMPPLPPAAPPPKPERSLVPGYVMLGLTAATLGTCAYFGIRALNAKNDFDDSPNDSNADDVEKFQMLSDLSFGAAVTFGLTALVYMTYEPEAAKDKAASTGAVPRLRIGAAATPRGASARATWSF